MPVYIDNAELETGPLGDAPSIGQALDAAKSRVAGSGRLILGIRCNSEEVDADQIGELLGAAVSEFDRLDFISGRPDEMVADALASTRRAFEDTFPVVREAADAISRGDLKKAMSLLSDCFNLWGQTHEAVVTSGRLLRLDFEKLSIEDRTLAESMTLLAEKLGELRSAFESRDMVQLGDILRYELDAALQEWERMLGGLIEQVRAGTYSTAA